MHYMEGVKSHTEQLHARVLQTTAIPGYIQDTLLFSAVEEEQESTSNYMYVACT